MLSAVMISSLCGRRRLLRDLYFRLPRRREATKKQVISSPETRRNC